MVEEEPGKNHRPIFFFYFVLHAVKTFHTSRFIEASSMHVNNILPSAASAPSNRFSLFSDIAGGGDQR